MGIGGNGGTGSKAAPANVDNGIMIIAYVNPRIQVHLVHVANVSYIVSSFFIGYIVKTGMRCGYTSVLKVARC